MFRATVFGKSARVLCARSLSHHGVTNYPSIRNDPFRHYAPGSPERESLSTALSTLRASAPLQVPCVVGGEEVHTGDVVPQVMPSDHGVVLAEVHQADEALVRRAMDAAVEAREGWSRMSLEDRAAVFLKAGDLVATKYRAEICAATMLGQGKTAWQAEIDAAVELVDFWRFAPKFAEELYKIQPSEHAAGTWNRMEFRPLEGFVFAVTPFNFTAIFGNLPASPAVMGNATVVKPAGTSAYSNYLCVKILEEAGLPPGVVNFLPGDGPKMGDAIFKDPRLAGLHFTGSTAVFRHMWKEVAANIDTYRSYPRVVGETGGKNFHFVHESADADEVVTSTVRSAFEYQGQKCSACSRMYVPSTRWPEIRDKLVAKVATIEMGQPDDLSTFMSAVIDDKAFARCKGYIDRARASASCEIIAGGNCDDSRGYFVEPTIILTTDPRYESMREEIFGPILTLFVYDPAKLDETLELCDSTSEYGLTGSVFATERPAIAKMLDALRHTAGNAYVNNPSTGSIVNAQPFGGGRASGTNDKSGSMLNLLRWVNARAIKENNVPFGPDITYPHMK